jgi:tetratricopeptide (TPR) repeat protein
LNSGNVAAADQILRNSLGAGILQESDSQVVTLLGKTSELLDREKERKKRIQDIVGELRELLRNGKFAAIIESGKHALESEGHNEEIADLVKQASIALALEETLQKRRSAELQSIRGLLAGGDPLQAGRVLEDAVEQGVLDRKAQEVVELQRQVKELILGQASVSPKIESVPVASFSLPVAPKKLAGNKWMLGAGGVVTLAVVGGVFYGVTHRPPPPQTPDNDEPLWEKAEAAMNRSPKDFKEGLAEYDKIARLHGSHRVQAEKKMSEIQDLQNKEEQLLQQAQQALQRSQPDYIVAMQRFQEVVNMDGDRKQEAEEGFKRAKSLSEGTDLRTLADDGLKRALNAFKRKDYLSAQTILQETLRSAPSDWNGRDEASGYLSRSEHRVQQHEILAKAEDDFRSKNYAASKAAATSAENVVDGDENDRTQARALLRKIESRIKQKNQFDDAQKLEISDPKQAKIKFQSVIDTPNGDEVLVVASRDELGKMEARNPPVKPYADLISVIETSIKQGDLSGAEEKLKSLPTTEADYSRLHDNLDDSIFEKNTAEAESALRAKDDPNRKAALQNLLIYFQRIAKQNSRHSPVANRYSQSVDAALNPVSNTGGSGDGGPSPPSGVSAEEKAAIQVVLNQYSNIFNRRRAKDLREIWPQISKAKTDTFQQFFESHKMLKQTLTPQKWESYGTGVLVTCQQILSYEQDGRLEIHPAPINFYMVKIQGSWKISDIPISADQ